MHLIPMIFYFWFKYFLFGSDGFGSDGICSDSFGSGSLVGVCHDVHSPIDEEGCRHLEANSDGRGYRWRLAGYVLHAKLQRLRIERDEGQNRQNIRVDCSIHLSMLQDCSDVKPRRCFAMPDDEVACRPYS